MTDDTRAQLDIIAQLNNRSVTEEVRKALEHWIEKSKTDPETARAEIEREAATKRGAIASILDNGGKASAKPAVAARPRKEGGE